jgi:hypothetical protein
LAAPAITKEEGMECENVDKIKPLDRLFEETIREFESGGDKECDEDLDMMIQELGDYEDEELPKASRRFDKKNPSEESLVEKKMVTGKRGRPRLVEGSLALEEITAGEDVAAARSISPETRRRRGSSTRGYQSLRKKM